MLGSICSSGRHGKRSWGVLESWYVWLLHHIWKRRLALTNAQARLTVL